MHDIRAIRENPTAYAAALSRRPAVDGKAEVAAILELDAKVRAAIQEKEAAEQARNAKSKEIGKAKAAKDEALAASLMADVAKAKETIESAAAREAEAIAARDDKLARLPNAPLDSVPEGADEHANVVQRVWDMGAKANDYRPSGLKSGAKLNKPKDHAELGEKLGMMDFEAAARMSGARFVVLRGQLARLERALAAFMLDVQTEENGYVEHAVPLLVRDHAMYGTGQLPKFSSDVYKTTDQPIDLIQHWFEENLGIIGDFYKSKTGKPFSGRFGDIGGYAVPEILGWAISQGHKVIEGEDFQIRYPRLQSLNEPSPSPAKPAFVTFGAKVQHILIPTAEVSLTNTVREQILDDAKLPMRLTAATPCFRSEAGSGGRDTRGMIRQHQFIKVELVSITKPEDSDAELERMTKCAEGILERLELPYRTIMLCTGDMGFGSAKTYDLEVWLPSQETYREISSCSTCGDFQARRMDARYRPAPTAENPKPKPEFVHTLNGSGLAVGRTLVAILENYQREDGTIQVPKALVPYMGGVEVIG